VSVLGLEGPVRHYAWGSRTVLPAMLGLDVPAQQPWAEIWLGAHPDGAARLSDGRSLADVAPDLSFMVKLLAAAEPLSVQAHPSREQAREGFAAEEALGIPHRAPHRSYKDANHKPELLVALTPVEALCGFRDPAETLRLVGLLDVPRLTAVTAVLAGPDPRTALRAAFAAVTGLPADERAALVGEVAAACHAHQVEAGPDAGALDWAARLATTYPGDPGIVAPLFLRVIHVAPGEGVFVRSGVLHAYLHGAGVEVQASSDNVLRGALTPKHIDVRELMRVVRFEVGPDPLVRPRPLGPGVDGYDVPVDDFAVWRIRPAGRQHPVPGAGRRIVVCVEGEVAVGGLVLPPARSAFLPGTADHRVTIAGTGTALVTAERSG